MANIKRHQVITRVKYTLPRIHTDDIDSSDIMIMLFFIENFIDHSTRLDI